MPKRKSSIGKCTVKAKRMKLMRQNETTEAHNSRLESLRTNNKQSRNNETNSQRKNRLKSLQLNNQRYKANESSSNRDKRLESMRVNAKCARLSENVSDRQVRLTHVCNRVAIIRQTQFLDLNVAAFHYNSDIDYS